MISNLKNVDRIEKPQFSLCFPPAYMLYKRMKMIHSNLPDLKYDSQQRDLIGQGLEKNIKC